MKNVLALLMIVGLSAPAFADDHAAAPAATGEAKAAPKKEKKEKKEEKKEEAKH